MQVMLGRLTLMIKENQFDIKLLIVSKMPQLCSICIIR